MPAISPASRVLFWVSSNDAEAYIVSPVHVLSRCPRPDA